MDILSTFLVAVVLFLYGTGTSWLQERFGGFQNLSPSVKQLVNSVINLVLPYIAVFVQPYWKPEFGNPEEVITSLLVLVAPFFVWVVSQLAHHFDPSRLVAGSLTLKKK